MELIITEKASVARTIASVLNITERADGFLRGKDMLISWCIGHLIELALPEAYDPKYVRWRYKDLPILPAAWQYSVSEATKKQFGIAFCSVSLDCTHKFRDVIRSGKLVAELSDKICEEHRLSVIKHPQDKTVSYDKWLGNNAKISSRDQLRMTIDAALRMQPDGFDALMQLLEDAGCWIKRGAQISIKPPKRKRYVRLDTLGAEYTEAALRSALAGHHVHIPKVPRSQFTPSQVELLIDIEAKLRAGKGKGYQRWAERHNTDAVAKSILHNRRACSA